MPTGWRKSKTLETQSDRQMKAPPRVYRQKNDIDDTPEPTKSGASADRYSKPFDDAQKKSIREAIKRRSMSGMRELSAPTPSAKAASRYGEKAVSR